MHPLPAWRSLLWLCPRGWRTAPAPSRPFAVASSLTCPPPARRMQTGRVWCAISSPLDRFLAPLAGGLITCWMRSEWGIFLLYCRRHPFLHAPLVGLRTLSSELSELITQTVTSLPVTPHNEQRHCPAALNSHDHVRLFHGVPRTSRGCALYTSRNSNVVLVVVTI